MPYTHPLDSLFHFVNKVLSSRNFKGAGTLKASIQDYNLGTRKSWPRSYIIQMQIVIQHLKK